MKILGIDPGIERLGWGILEKTLQGILYIDSGVKKTLKTKSQSERLLEIYQFLDVLMKTSNVDVVSTEKLFFATNAKTAIIIGEVRGVILTSVALHKKPLVEFTPLQIKMAVCGNGKADKKEVARMLGYSMALPQKSMLDDETDALAIALTAVVTRNPN